MDYMQAMVERHSVRSYLPTPIESSKAALLQGAVQEANWASGLHIQLKLQEPGAFSGPLARYGVFRGCSNYFAIVAGDHQEDAIGYYGEKLVLYAQILGLNTCWVGLSYRKRAVPVDCGPGEKLQMVIALGYGENQGKPHRSKPMKKLCRTEGAMPQWFRAGMEAAMLAPTAVNQQKFRFIQQGNIVHAQALAGPFSKVDLGIARFHFELGAGKENFRWA